MKKIQSSIQNSKHESLDKIYDKALENLKKLYTDSFELVDLYGDFYVMTNRIWVTTENIYQLYEKKSRQIQEEMEKNHIHNLEENIEDVLLDEFTFRMPTRVKEIKKLSIQVEDNTILDCSLDFKVNNSNLVNV